MNLVTPNQYKLNLIEVLKAEKEKLVLFKNEAIKAMQFEEASSFRDLEKELDDLLSNLDSRTNF